MANMSYCRFENTAKDLADCLGHVDDDNLSKTEKASRLKIYEMCIDYQRKFKEKKEEEEAD